MRWLLLLAACGSSQSHGPDGTTPAGQVQAKAEMDSCTTDADCTLVDACCGCSAGGRKVAIRLDAVNDYNASRPQRCGGEMCAQMMSTHLSCDAEASCGQNGHCRIQPHMQHATQ